MATRFSQHPSVLTCCVLLTGIASPYLKLLQPRVQTGLSPNPASLIPIQPSHFGYVALVPFRSLGHSLSPVFPLTLSPWSAAPLWLALPLSPHMAQLNLAMFNLDSPRCLCLCLFFFPIYIKKAQPCRSSPVLSPPFYFTTLFLKIQVWQNTSSLTSDSSGQNKADDLTLRRYVWIIGFCWLFHLPYLVLDCSSSESHSSSQNLLHLPKAHAQAFVSHVSALAFRARPVWACLSTKGLTHLYFKFPLLPLGVTRNPRTSINPFVPLSYLSSLPSCASDLSSLLNFPFLPRRACSVSSVRTHGFSSLGQGPFPLIPFSLSLSSLLKCPQFLQAQLGHLHSLRSLLQLIGALPMAVFPVIHFGTLFLFPHRLGSFIKASLFVTTNSLVSVQIHGQDWHTGFSNSLPW